MPAGFVSKVHIHTGDYWGVVISGVAVNGLASANRVSGSGRPLAVVSRKPQRWVHQSGLAVQPHRHSTPAAAAICGSRVMSGRSSATAVAAIRRSPRSAIAYFGGQFRFVVLATGKRQPCPFFKCQRQSDAFPMAGFAEFHQNDGGGAGVYL